MLTLKDETRLRSQNFVEGERVDGGAGTIEVTNPTNAESAISER